MPERPRFFDDLAGVAGGAMSALSGLRDEAESLARARVDEVVRSLNLVRRDELDAAEQMAARARAGQEAAEQKLGDMAARLASLEGRVAALEAHRAASQPAASVGGGGPGMIA